MTELKICKDCRHCWNTRFIPDLEYKSFCINPKVNNVNLVTGLHQNILCYTARNNEELCGKTAKLFEPFYPNQW